MNNKDFSVTHRWVPPYTSSIDKTFSPGERRWITADVAALPDEKATQYFVFSAAATALSKTPRVGLPVLEYS